MNVDKMYGEAPTSSVVFAACDSKYFMEHASAFIYSANEIDKDVHVHVINPNDDVFSLACFLNATTDVRVTYTFNDYEVSSNTEEARTLYACLRFLVLPKLIESAGEVLTFDIDCILMREFDFPKEALGYFPRKCFGDTEWQRKGTRILAGVFYACKKSLKVCKEISTRMMSAKRKWYVDQIIIADVIEEIYSNYSIKKYDDSFMDWKFVKGTKVWTGKGPRKHDNPIYIQTKSKKGKISTSKHKKVLLRPRLDIPFKKFGLFTANSFDQPIRKHWRNFCDNFIRENPDALVVEAPVWMQNATIDKYFTDDCTIYVPHAEKHVWKSKNPTFFYMQTVFPWLFTVDELGWGGGAKFVKSFNPKDNYTDEFFNNLKTYLQKGGTKFKQPSKSTSLENLQEEFILVPLQIPNDAVIKYHADITCPQFVESLCKWADKPYRPKVVFKPHPVNPRAMQPLKDIILKHKNTIYLDQPVHIHDAIKKSTAVYVINSGVGQEAMLLDKPVAAFGLAEYSNAVINGHLEKLDETWDRVQNIKTTEMKKLYRKWYHWYNKNLINTNTCI